MALLRPLTSVLRVSTSPLSLSNSKVKCFVNDSYSKAFSPEFDVWGVDVVEFVCVCVMKLWLAKYV